MNDIVGERAVALGLRRAALTGLAAALLCAWPAPAQVPIDSSTFGGLEARAIGPAVMGGRIAALDAVREETLVIYVGAAGGGLWKSDDGGLSFDPIFDDSIQSIGAVHIDPSDSQKLWVGTGEAWTRNSVSIGDGVYVSRDGGESWEHKGLVDSERITRIVIHPEDGKTVWVCATGHLWDANEERGVYRTRDDGETWERVLSVDADTGCSDLDIDPQDPDILYAGMWQFRRYPWSFTSGGPGSGLYRSLDGGDSWQELTEGLPEGEKGRIAVGVAPSRANRVYALVEAEDTALYRSDDLGGRWEQVNDSFFVSARPFYFANVFVDPIDPDRVYKPGLQLGISTDGGESFTPGGSMHSDLHAMWVNPDDPHELLVGTDGGLYHSYDRGRTFRHARALPISQFYEVAADMAWPYNVYGGLQDNGTWMGPSRSSGGIGNAEWRNIGFGDGFHAYPDPQDPDIVFVQYQGGQLMRIAKSTGEIKEIKPYPGLDDPDYRCNWNTAVHLPARGGTLYAGCQFLFRSEDRGESWRRISADLTTNDPEKQQQKTSGGLSIDNSTAENHTTIFTISESPKDPRVLWVGTDDGNLQVSRDGGESWSNVAVNVPDLAPLTWVSHVDASPHAAGTAFVTFDGHRLGDMSTYVYRTDDYGATWRSLVPVEDQEDGLESFAHIVVQDPVNPDLLFVGTELGLYLSLDGGQRWARFSGNLPKVSVRDLDIHPRDHDLIIGTHGRGIYIVDDLTPLRALRAESLDESLVVLPSRPSVQMISAQIQAFPGADEFVGATLPEVASIFYYQKRRHIFGDMKLEVFDSAGELITTLGAGKRKGINRVDWPMRRRPPTLPAASTLARAMMGPRVPEGTYTYRITKGKETFEGEIELVADPRSSHSREDRALQQTLANRLYDVLDELTYVVDALVDLRDQASARAEGARPRIARRLEELQRELESLRSEMVSTAQGGFLAGDEQLREQLGNVFGAIAGYDGRPTQSQVDRAEVLAQRFEQLKSRFEALASEESLTELNPSLDQPLVLLTRAAWNERERRGIEASPPSRAAWSGVLVAGPLVSPVR